MPGQLVDKDTIHRSVIENLLIGAKRRGGSAPAPRKAKRLERKSTDLFYFPTKMKKLKTS